MKYRLSIPIVFIAAAAFPAAAQTANKSVRPVSVGRKVALVIGNTAYRAIPIIPPAINDANDIAQTLRTLRFDTVQVKTDLGADAMIGAIAAFSRTEVQPGDLALIYYSGHGGQVGDENYLLPVDYDPPSDAELVERRGGYRMSRARDALEAKGARVRVLIFDACRNSPVITSKSASPGLRAMEGRPEGTLIAFASAHNQVARYQSGQRNSFYTAQLLAALGRAGTDLKELLEGVQHQVYERTEHEQTPYLYGFLSGPLYLGGAPLPPSPVEAPAGIPRNGFLAVSTDAPVNVALDGEPAVQLAADEVKRFPLLPGSHFVVATSVARSSIVQRRVVEVRSGEQQTLQLEFAQPVGQAIVQEFVTLFDRINGVGHWTETMEIDGNFTDGGKGKYHFKSEGSLEITRDANGLSGVWRDTQKFTADQSFVRYFEATFQLKREGNQITGTASVARRRDDQGDWKDYKASSFKGKLDGDTLTVSVEWDKDSDGKLIEWNNYTFTRQSAAGIQ